MLEVGQIVEGIVTGLTTFGAFVALPDGKSGMVHISEVSNVFVKEIKDHLTEGQDVKVKIIAIGIGLIIYDMPFTVFAVNHIHDTVPYGSAVLSVLGITERHFAVYFIRPD